MRSPSTWIVDGSPPPWEKEMESQVMLPWTINWPWGREGSSRSNSRSRTLALPRTMKSYPPPLVMSPMARRSPMISTLPVMVETPRQTTFPS